MQGLSDEVQARLPHWVPATTTWSASMDVSMLSGFAQDEIQAGTQAALMQLACLPAGSVIQVGEYGFDRYLTWGYDYRAVVAAIRAASVLLPHLTILPPLCTAEVRREAPVHHTQMITWLCQLSPPMAHMRVAVCELCLPQPLAHLSWPLERIEFRAGMKLSDLLRLPRTTGPYEFQIIDLHADDHTVGVLHTVRYIVCSA